MSEKLKRAYTKQARYRPHPHFLSRSTLNRPLRLPGSVELVTALTLSLSTPAFAAGGVKINDLVFAASIPDAQREATMKAVHAFYDFWNTGDEGLLKEAIAPNFTDHTLPPGRPQGPEGPAFASRRFRAAVPDLEVTVEKMIVAGDYVTVHMSFTGHFTGKFGDAGQRPAGPLHRDRSRQDREGPHHRQLAHRGQSDAAPGNGRRQGRLITAKRVRQSKGDEVLSR
jgi:predicted ester cyclase